MIYRFAGYRCSLCASTYGPAEVTYTCPKDGGNLDVVMDTAAIRKSYSPSQFSGGVPNSLWRYASLMPVAMPQGETPLHAAGGTPVFATDRLAARLGMKHLWIKDESRNPTASFKDRASSVVVARAIEIGAEVVITASTGNAGAALAGMAAAVGQKAVVVAPRTAPAAKVAQLLIFGARVVLVDGNYDAAFDLTLRAADEFGWYCRNTGYNPFTLEGKKTAGFEVWEWWEATKKKQGLQGSLSIFVSVGDGNIIAGIHKGYRDLTDLGWLDQMPRIFGVQALGSAAIANAFSAKTEKITPVSANTLADSISVDLPRDGVRAVRAATQTKGSYVLVSDDEILSAVAELGPNGIFAEPAGATAYAGLVKARKTGLIAPEDAVLVMNTGSGLKDVKSAMRAVKEAPIVEPSLRALKSALGKV